MVENVRRKTEVDQGSSRICTFLCAVMAFGLLVIGGASDDVKVTVERVEDVSENPESCVPGQGVHNAVTGTVNFTTTTVKEPYCAAKSVKSMLFENFEGKECCEAKFCNPLEWENFSSKKSAAKVAGTICELSSVVADIGAFLGESTLVSVQKMRKALEHTQECKEDEDGDWRESSPGVLRSLETAPERINLAVGISCGRCCWTG